MMKKLIVLFAGLMFLALASMAQHGTLKGTVYYTGSRVSIPGVNVYVLTGGNIQGTTTDIDGAFTLKPLNPGMYNLHLSCTGLDSVVISGVQVLPDKIEFLGDIYMSEKSQDIGGVDVIAHKQKLINPEDPGKMSLLPAQLERTPGKRDMSNLITLVSPEIKIDTETNQIIVRGSRPGTSVYYVDGIKVSTTESLLPNTGIGSVTVYSGGIPAKYGDMTGGAVIMESKSYFDLLSAWEASQLFKKPAEDKTKPEKKSAKKSDTRIDTKTDGKTDRINDTINDTNDDTKNDTKNEKNNETRSYKA